jgi:hypothetical protein
LPERAVVDKSGLVRNLMGMHSRPVRVMLQDCAHPVTVTVLLLVMNSGNMKIAKDSVLFLHLNNTFFQRWYLPTSSIQKENYREEMKSIERCS